MIALHDYSVTAAQKGWGAGWPSCNGAKAAGTAVITTRRSGCRISVHKRVARLLDLILNEIERRGYLFTPGKCGGYNCRSIAGTNSPSNHSWGLAVDLDWDRNPYRTPVHTTFPNWLIELFNHYGFAWGGLYGDAMHFEFMGTPSDADAMTALALREISGGPAASPSAAPQPPRKDIEPVVPIELNVGADGRFRTTVMAEAGKTSEVVKRQWVSFGSTWGGTHFDVCALDLNGVVMGPNAEKHVDLANNKRDGMELPSGVAMVTIEGHVLDLGAIPAAALISEPV